MVEAFFKGALLGLTIAFIIGPSFFAMIQISLHRGLRAGIQFAFGVVFSDITLITLSYLGILQLLQSSSNKVITGIIGGFILIAYGLASFTKKAKQNEPDTQKIYVEKKPIIFSYILKGFLMNIANPFLLIFWMGAMSLISSNYEMQSGLVMSFFIGTITFIFLTDVLKCLIAQGLKKIITPKFIFIVNRIVGISLVVFGVSLIFRVTQNYF